MQTRQNVMHREYSWQNDEQHDQCLTEEPVARRDSMTRDSKEQLASPLAESLDSLLQRVYESIGTEDACTIAKAMASSLARELHVTSVSHLIQSLHIEGELHDLRGLVRGRAFTALVAELNRVHAADLARQPQRTYARRELELSVLRVDLINISAIDEISQTFAARLYVQCAFRGGARDEHLSSDSRGFPVDALGTPTFRPSAAWFLDQVEFHNAKFEVTQLDYRVVRMDDDLVLKYVDPGDRTGGGGGVVSQPLDQGPQSGPCPSLTPSLL